MTTMILDVYGKVYLWFGGLMHQLTTGGPHIVPPGIPGDYPQDNPSGVGSSESLPGDGRMGHLTTLQLGLICFLKPLPMTTFC